jgi:hypothetical protein
MAVSVTGTVATGTLQANTTTINVQMTGTAATGTLHANAPRTDTYNACAELMTLYRRMPARGLKARSMRRL